MFGGSASFSSPQQPSTGFGGGGAFGVQTSNATTAAHAFGGNFAQATPNAPAFGAQPSPFGSPVMTFFFSFKMLPVH